MEKELHLQVASVDMMVDPDSAESVQEAEETLSRIEGQMQELRGKIAKLSSAHLRKKMEKAGWIYVGGGCYTPGPTVPPIDWSSSPSPKFLAELQRCEPEIFEQLFGEKTQK